MLSNNVAVSTLNVPTEIEKLKFEFYLHLNLNNHTYRSYGIREHRTRP